MNQLKKIFELLNKKIKIELYILYIFILIAVVLEVLGIGLLIPLFDIILNKNHLFINIISDRLNFTNLEITVLFIFVIFYFLKTLFLSLLAYKRHFFRLRFKNIFQKIYIKGTLNKDIIIIKTINHLSK